MNYESKINRALAIQKSYLSIAPKVTNTIKSFSNKDDPDINIEFVTKSFILSGSKLAGQIMNSLEKGYLQIAIVGARTLFELSVNSVYIFNHPKEGQNKKRMKRICDELILLSNKTDNVSHTRFDNKTFKERLSEIKEFKDQYSGDYRIMSEFAHLMLKTIYISCDEGKGKIFSLQIASKCLQSLHNIFDSISAYCEYTLEPSLEKSVVDYTNLIESAQ